MGEVASHASTGEPHWIEPREEAVSGGTTTEELQQFFDSHHTPWDRWSTKATFLPDPFYADYAEIGGWTVAIRRLDGES